MGRPSRDGGKGGCGFSMAEKTAKYHIGIDIGSTTIKTVILDGSGKAVYQNYERHMSETRKALLRHLQKIRQVTGGEGFTLALTGSSAMGIAQEAGIPFEQEVIACAAAVEKLIPQTDTAIELGGEDAKITYFRGSMEQRMNGACAGGTGSFIDQMAALLSTDAAGLNALAEKGREIHTIASRCGVFAKTDVQALMNTGISREDIALSVFQAVVNQTIGNLAQGRPIKGRVAFLGGPLHFLPLLRERFVKTLGLGEGDVVKVEDSNYFVARGAALCESSRECDLDSIIGAVSKPSKRTSASSELTLSSRSLTARRSTRPSRRATLMSACRAQALKAPRGLCSWASTLGPRPPSLPAATRTTACSTPTTAQTAARRSGPL